MIDYELDDINNDNTSVLFQQVIRNYYSENYRGCVTDLYTLVIYDLSIKIKKEVNESQNTDLKKIVDGIDDRHRRDTNYNEIENYIYKELRTLKKISKHMSKKIDYLRTERNQCGHLVLIEDGLYYPTKSIVSDFMQYFYNNLFTKNSKMLSDLGDEIVRSIDSCINSELYTLSNIESIQSYKKQVGRTIQQYIDNNEIKSLHSILFRKSFNRITDEKICEIKKYYFYALEELLRRLYEFKGVDVLNDKNIISEYDIFLLEDKYDPIVELWENNSFLKLVNKNYINIDMIKVYNIEFYTAVENYLKGNVRELRDNWPLIFNTRELNEYVKNNGGIDHLQLLYLNELYQDVAFNLIKKSITHIEYRADGRDHRKSHYVLNYVQFFHKKLDESMNEEILKHINRNKKFFKPQINHHLIRRMLIYCNKEFSFDISQLENIRHLIDYKIKIEEE